MATDRPSGEWERRVLAWWEPPDAHCELCGRPLTGRRFIARVDGVERGFCGPDCELLFRARSASAPPSR